MMKSVAKFFFLVSSLLILAACGGGGSIEREGTGGGGGGSSPDPSEFSVTLQTVDSNGNQSSSLSEGNNLIVRATVLGSDSSPAANQLVTFAIEPSSLANFVDNTTSTANTNAEGIAEITMRVGSETGSGSVTATLSTGATATTAFNATGSPTASGLAMRFVDANDNETSNLTANTPLTLEVTYTDSANTPIPGAVLTFSASPEELATFGNDTSTALTDSLGIARIGVSVGSISGSGTISVTSPDGLSNTIGFTSEGPIPTTGNPDSLGLFASQPQLSSGGSDNIELSAIVKNAQNVLLEGIAVSFSADSNASIQAVSSVTNENGIATALLSTINEPENRVVTVSASVLDNPTNNPELTSSVEIAVVGTELSIVGPNSVIVGDATDFNILLADSENRGIAGEAVDLRVTDDSGNDVTNSVITADSFVTNSNGRITFSFSAADSGTYALSASALNTASVFSIIVQQDQFTFVNAPDIDNIEEDLPLNQFHPITVRWLKDNAPFVGGNVELSISRGEIEDDMQTTNSSGTAVFNIRSDNAGKASILAIGTDGDGDEVTARIEVSFIATEVNSIIVDATPDAIGPDSRESTISAVVRDSAGNRVGNQRVNFNVSDVSNGELTLSQATTDRRGIASTVFISNAVSSNEAVVVTASVGSVSGQATLTVGDRPFDISLGTGRLIQSPNNSSYRKEFSVFVTDADGNPVPNADISMSITPLRVTEGNTFYKGTWYWNDDASIYVDTVIDPTDNSVLIAPTGCDNEDINFNGILDVGEDTNSDGQLTPGNAASITPAEVTTDDNGQALVFVEYPRQFGNWVRTKVTARSQSGGSESRESMFFRLSVAIDDLTVEGSPPPSSPYGIGTNCADIN